MNIAQWEILKCLDTLDPIHKPGIVRCSDTCVRYDWPGHSKVHGTVIFVYQKEALIKVFCTNYPDGMLISANDNWGCPWSFRQHLNTMLDTGKIKKPAESLSGLKILDPSSKAQWHQWHQKHIFHFFDFEDLLKEIIC